MERHHKILDKIKSSEHSLFLKETLDLFDDIRKTSPTTINCSLDCVYEALDILIDSRLDVQTLCCSILSAISYETLQSRQEFILSTGENSMELLKLISLFKEDQEITTKELRVTENIKQLLNAGAIEPKIIFIKVAYMLATLREAIKLNSKNKIQIAAQSLEIYTPIADRLGFHKIKMEMQHIAFKELYPEEFQRITNFLSGFKASKEKQFKKVQGRIFQAIKNAGYDCQVYGRVKEAYSIYSKTIQKQMPLNELFDLFAYRIVTSSAHEAYELLGIMHDTFKPISNRFKDYIAKPKKNGYQSLHTSLLDDDNNYFEVQIRSKEMDEFAEMGLAAHWAYKHKEEGVPSFNSELNWIRDLNNKLKQAANPNNVLKMFEGEFSSTSLYVFTPKGKVIKLPQDSTVIDFAYAIHSDVGNRCSGAKVDEKFVNIKTILKNGNVVDITTSKKTSPKSDWLQTAKTSKALQHIRMEIKREEVSIRRQEGSKKLVKFFKTINQKYDKLENHPLIVPFLKKFKIGSTEELLEKIGTEEIKQDDLAGVTKTPNTKESEKDTLQKPSENISDLTVTEQSSYIKGQRFIPVRLAKCCSPTFPDEIIGLADGVNMVVHQENCEKLYDIDHNKLIDIAWENPIFKKIMMKIKLEYPMDFSLTAKIFKQVGKHQSIFDSESLEKNGIMLIQHLTIKSNDENVLKSFTENIQKLKNIKLEIIEQNVSG
mgnify:CR=1 FL=1